MWRLQCQCMNYEWGKRGSASAVAELKRKSDGSTVDEAKPYAEFWFGTHPSGPSSIHVNGGLVSLQAWLEAHPQELGTPLYSPASALPYLFKVLSVEKALSVQAHPDKALAARLHAAAPVHYRDANHKPEMMCALTPFEAMCKFRAPQDLASHLASAPELVSLMGGAHLSSLQRAAAESAATSDATAVPAFQAALRSAYAAYMSSSDEAVKAAVEALQARLAAAGVDGTAGATLLPGGGYAPPSADAVALRLCRQFPGDVGVFAPYFLNLLALSPGQAVFLPANEPHAYLSGDCMEVMAASDNVVRAGLTPKFKDTPTLLSMLTYAAGEPGVLRGVPASFDAAHTLQYDAPVPEFVLYKTEVPAGAGRTVTLHAPPSAAVVVILRGRGRAVTGGGPAVDVTEGQVWLQGAGQEVSVTCEEGGVLFFRTHANVAASAHV